MGDEPSIVLEIVTAVRCGRLRFTAPLEQYLADARRLRQSRGKDDLVTPSYPNGWRKPVRIRHWN